MCGMWFFGFGIIYYFVVVMICGDYYCVVCFFKCGYNLC